MIMVFGHGPQSFTRYEIGMNLRLTFTYAANRIECEHIEIENIYTLDFPDS